VQQYCPTLVGWVGGWLVWLWVVGLVWFGWLLGTEHHFVFKKKT